MVRKEAQNNFLTSITSDKFKDSSASGPHRTPIVKLGKTTSPLPSPLPTTTTTTHLPKPSHTHLVIFMSMMNELEATHPRTLRLRRTLRAQLLDIRRSRRRQHLECGTWQTATPCGDLTPKSPAGPQQIQRIWSPSRSWHHHLRAGHFLTKKERRRQHPLQRERGVRVFANVTCRIRPNTTIEPIASVRAFESESKRTRFAHLNPQPTRRQTNGVDHRLLG